MGLEHSWMSGGTLSEGRSALDVSGPALHCSEHYVGVQCPVPCVPSVARRLLDSCNFTLAVVFWDGLANALRFTEFVHNSTTGSHTHTGSQKR